MVGATDYKSENCDSFETKYWDGGGKISGTKSFNIKHFHFSLKGLAVLFFIAMYLSVIIFSRSCVLNSEKSNDCSFKLHL